MLDTTRDFRINVSHVFDGEYYAPLPNLINRQPLQIVVTESTTHNRWDFYLDCRESGTTAHYHIDQDGQVSTLLEERYACPQSEGIVVAVHVDADPEQVAAFIDPLTERVTADGEAVMAALLAPVRPKPRRSSTRVKASALSTTE